MNNCCASCGASIKRNRKFCNVQCQKDYDYVLYIQKWKAGLVDGCIINGNLSNHIRRFIHEKFNKTCCECSISKWMEQPISLEIDHIDGNHQNCSEDNLRLLCPNCHSQTPTFRAKNTGFGRKYRRV